MSLISDPTVKEENKTFTVELGEEKLLPELETALMEMAVGESRKVNGKFPEEYGDTKLAGKEAIFPRTIAEETDPKTS